MSYFANRSFNLVYVHAALQAFASYGGEAFAFVYLLKAGIPAPLVLLAIGTMFGSRMIFRQLVLPLVRLVGLRRALVVAILAEAATYPILSQITGTLGGVTDTASAQASVTRLTEAGATLATVQDQAGALSTEGKSALAAMVSSALPAIQAASDKLSSDSAIGGVMKTALDAVLARLTALAA